MEFLKLLSQMNKKEIESTPPSLPLPPAIGMNQKQHTNRFPNFGRHCEFKAVIYG